MLSPAYRLPKEVITEVMRSGARVLGDGLLIRYKKTTSIPRFAFVISAKVDKRATKRNRMRRVLSESVRHLFPHIAPADCVLVVQKNIADISQKEAEALVGEVLRKAHFNI